MKGQNQKRIVIAGGPSTGKTSLISHIKEKELAVKEEISRAIIDAYQQKGIDQLFLTNPMLFSKLLFEGRKKDFLEATSNAVTYFDRGMPDVTAYMDYKKERYPYCWDAQCMNHRYDLIFLLPPWKAIHVVDEQRYETFEMALDIHEALKKRYIRYGYTPITIPTGTLEQRFEFIQQTIKDTL